MLEMAYIGRGHGIPRRQEEYGVHDLATMMRRMMV
jgi:hypothetical protein